MRSAQLVVSALLLGLLVAACAPKAAPAPAASSAAQAAWQAEWERTVAAAKQEGKVVAGITGGIGIGNALRPAFKDAYGISLEHVAGAGVEVNLKILSERRAGLYTFDVVTAASTPAITQLKPANALAPLEPTLILPDVTSSELIKKIWYKGSLYWVDKDRMILAMSMYTNMPIAINTNLVKAGEIKSWRDILDPKWKDKIIVEDPTIPGAGISMLQSVDNLVGRDFLYELAKAEPIVMRDLRLSVDWLAHGKVAMVVPPREEIYRDFKEAGAPLAVVIPKEGTWLTDGVSSLGWLNQAPHPNAAKVFINWLLTKEGQTVYSRAVQYQSTREDVPTNFLPKDVLRDPKVRYYERAKEEVALSRGPIEQLAKELFGPLAQKAKQ